MTLFSRLAFCGYGLPGTEYDAFFAGLRFAAMGFTDIGHRFAVAVRGRKGGKW